MDEGLDKQVRRVDEDRWLASRFAPANVRTQLIALYAVNHELARAATVTEAALGAIRLAWWREAIEEIYARRPPRAHPALVAFAAALPESAWPRETVEALIQARSREIDTAALASSDELNTHIEATIGSLMRLALEACGVAPSPHEHFILQAAHAWGWVGLARGGRTPQLGQTQENLLDRARQAHAAARALARFLPAKAFPAVGYVALSSSYARAVEAGKAGVTLLGRQLRLIGASATGRL